MNIINSRNILCFFILILLSIPHNSLVVIPFKVSTIPKIQLNKDYNSTNFLSEYFHRDFYANLFIGIPNKRILTLIDTQNHNLEFVNNFLNKKSLDEIIDPENTISKSTYDYSQSLSFQNISKFYYSNVELKVATLCSETFLLYEDLSMKEVVPVENVKFIIDEGSEEKLHIQLGLNKPMTKDFGGPPSFIHSLLEVGVIKDQSWTFKFLSENDGLFILGGEPHMYQDISKDKKYQRQYFFETNSLSVKEYHNPWSISAQKVFMKDQNGEDIIINENKGCYLNYNLGFIIGTKEYREYIKNHFFDELINLKICSYDLVHFLGPNDMNNRYYAYSCDKTNFKEKYYEVFPNLYFYIFDYNYNFVLTKEDLFIEINDKLYFMIIFEKKSIEHPELINWNLGLPFLKKYEFVHNYEKETVGFYIPYEEEEKKDSDKQEDKEDKKEKESSENEPKEDDNKKFIFIIIVVCIASVILIIAVFLITKKMYQSRKERANELNDNDFEYISKNNEFNNNKKEIN